MSNENRHCELDHQLLGMFDDPEDIVRMLVVKPTLKETLSLSDTVLTHLFQVGVEAYEARCYDKAIDVFAFLTTASPCVPNFWIGLGQSFQKIERYADAVKAYKIGICLGADGVEPFVFAVQCLTECEGVDEALEFIDKAMDVIGERADGNSLYQDLAATKAYVLSSTCG